MHGAPAIRTRLWLGGLASGGVVAAHWLAYRLTTPAGHHGSDSSGDDDSDALPIILSAIGAGFGGLALVVALTRKSADTP